MTVGQGKSAWISEHSALLMNHKIVYGHLDGHEYTPEDLGPNPTCVPDWLFDTCKPIIVIRHPARMIPSFYKTMSAMSYNLPGDEDFYLCTSLRYSRMLHDLFRAQGREAIVVDGDDVIWRTQEMTSNVCNVLGIDPEGVKEQWEPTAAEQRPTHPIIAGFTTTIHESTGVERPSGGVSTIAEMRSVE